MYAQKIDHCQVVMETLSSARKADELSFASLAVLEDRLERLKKLGSRFAGITFSPAAQSLLHTKEVVLS